MRRWRCKFASLRRFNDHFYGYDRRLESPNISILEEVGANYRTRDRGIKL